MHVDHMWITWIRYSQTGTILRVPHMAEGVSLVGRAGAMDERDKLMAEEFMMWVSRQNSLVTLERMTKWV